MGMYTEVVFRATINRSKIGDRDFHIFDYMFNPNTELEMEDLDLPDHEFFACSRWYRVGNSNSFYHHPNRVVDWYIPECDINESFPDVYIFSRNDIKDYENEIDKFFNWVSTLNIFYEDEYMGYSLYEEFNTPKIYRANALSL